jgi:hypothetical protein
MDGQRRPKESTMTKDRDALDRRSFLRSASGTATLLATVAATTPVFVSEAEAYDPGQGETKSKYQPDAPDVQAFYRTNGYETLTK